MITSTMTHDEIWKQFLSCKERFVPWLKHKMEEWHKIEKRQLPAWYGGKVFEWNNRQLNLRVLSIHCRLKGSGYGQAHATFIPVDTHHGTQYYKLHSVTHAIYIYTAHCLKRYAERMGYMHNLPQLLAKMEARNPVMLNIYDAPDGKRCVLAVRDGLFLVEYDPVRKVNIMRTFVSNAMLSETQRKAHDVVAQLNPYFDKCFGSMAKDGSTALMHLVLPEVTKSFRAEAQAIYASYWEDKE